MTDYSDMFQKVKHSGYEPTDAEKSALRQYLLRDDSKARPETHAAVYVFCLCHGASSENIAVVERFLDDDTDDYTRRAALVCLTTIWQRHDPKYVKYIIATLNRLGDTDFGETVSAAFRAAFSILRSHRNSNLVDAIDEKVKFFYDELENRNSTQEDLLVRVCFFIIDAYSIHIGKGRHYINTLEEAKDVYMNKDEYLSVWR